MRLIGDSEASLEALRDKTIAVLGYGNQGRAQALNLRDSGVSVVVGNRDDQYRAHATSDGFEVLEIQQAASESDVLLVLTTDESQPLIWKQQIEPGVAPGNTLVWASGYNIGFGLIDPPSDVDVVMVAPRMTGAMVRNLFERGKGAIAQFAIQQDASGGARLLTLALCKAIGLTRGGVFESTFREEAELDLFAEQVVWAGLTAWFLECFEVGVEAGFSPELMVMELYASGEASEILGHMSQHGFFRQLQFHSTTSQFGTLSCGPSLISSQTKQKARQILREQIKGGEFARQWSDEQASGSKNLGALMEKALAHDMSIAEQDVIRQINEAHALDE